MGEFDPEDKNSWYFGPLNREEANNSLMGERESGVFLVRDSNSIRGDFVLCVKEDNRVSHYIINRIQVSGSVRFRIGDQDFPDLPSLLSFYKTHFLDTTALTRPAPREKVIAKFDFEGRDPEDLPFKRGDVLTVLRKDEEQWWTAKNSQDQTGLIPVPYIEILDSNTLRQLQKASQYNSETPEDPKPAAQAPPTPQTTQPKINCQRSLPAKARVIKQRIPNAYDQTALKLEVGDEVLVLSTNINGQWHGECRGVQGLFPFTHVQFIEDEDLDN